MNSSNQTFDLLIVGGGVLGTFHAYHAQRRGLKVALLERSLSPRGATVRNFGQVVPSGMDAHWQRLGRESLRIYAEISQKVDLSVRQQGTIYLASDEEEVTLIEELHRLNSDNDYASQLWTAQQCRTRYPQLRADYCRAGLFFPDEVSVNPRVMIHQLHRYLSQQSDCELYFQTGIQELTTRGLGGVQATSTDGRVFTADEAIVCCGSEFQCLYPELFAASDLEAVKLQMLRLKPQTSVSIPGNVLTGLSIRRYESFSQCPSWNEINAGESDDTFAKQWGVHLLFKQELDGGIILGDSHEYAPASRIDELDFDLRNDVNDFFVDEGKKIFDLPSWEIETSWYGVYCQTEHPSGIFTRNVDENIHIATGIGGKGMTSSAGFAEHHLKEIYDD